MVIAVANHYAEFGIADFVPSRWLCRADGVEAVVCPAATRVLVVSDSA